MENRFPHRASQFFYRQESRKDLRFETDLTAAMKGIDATRFSMKCGFN